MKFKNAEQWWVLNNKKDNTKVWTSLECESIVENITSSGFTLRRFNSYKSDWGEKIAGPFDTLDEARAAAEILYG